MKLECLIVNLDDKTVLVDWERCPHFDEHGNVISVEHKPKWGGAESVSEYGSNDARLCTKRVAREWVEELIESGYDNVRYVNILFPWDTHRGPWDM